MSPKLENVLYAPLNAALHLLAYTPWWWIYFNADVAYVLAYHVLRYRRKVVRNNLVTSFPGKSQHEIKRIEKQFYRNLADYFFETVKLLHISDDEIRRRMVFHGVEQADELLSQGKSIIMYFAHCFNWEWVLSMTLWSKYPTGGNITFAQVYRPLKNKWFDRFFLRLRARYHSVCYPKATVARDMLQEMRLKHHQVMIGFMSDQHPNINDQHHVLMFLNHPTAIITGTEKIARKLGMAVLYFDMEKNSRGHYECTLRPICNDAKQTPEGWLTDQYATMLQRTIERDPAIWLWTHNRWKHKVELPELEQNKEEKA